MAIRKAMHFLGVLDDADVSWLAAHGTKRFMPAGTILIREGETTASLFILLEGQVSITIKGGFLLATLHPGEILGEISFIDSRPPLATVTAIQNSSVLTVPREVVRRHLESDLGFAARFYRAVALCLANRLRVTSSRLGYGSVLQDTDPTELDDPLLDNLALGAIRFDTLLRTLSMPMTEAGARAG